MSPVTARFLDGEAVAGVEWRSGSPPFLSLASHAVAWRGHHVITRESWLSGLPTLGQVISSYCGIDVGDTDRWSGAVMLTCSWESPEDNQPWYWSLTLADGVPSAGSEFLARSIEDYRQYVRGECATGQLSRIILFPGLEGVLDAADTPRETMQEAADSMDEVIFLFERRLGPLLAYGGIGLVLLVGALQLTGWLSDDDRYLRYLAIAGIYEMPIEVVALPYVRSWNDFATGCLAAHSRPWPVAPGWTIATEGCRHDATADSETIPVRTLRGAAWRRYQLAGEHDPFLARRAAETVTTLWQDRYRVSDGEIIAWREFDVSEEDWDWPDLDMDQLSVLVARNFLGVGRVTMVSGEINIRTTAGWTEIFRRLTTVYREMQFGIAMFVRGNDGQVEIMLRSPMIIRRMPDGSIPQEPQ